MSATILATDRFAHPIQVLEPGVVQNVAFNAASSTATTNNLQGPTVVVRLMATVDCYVACGPAASVSATTASMYLPAYMVEYFRVDANSTWKVAARGVAASGVLNVTEMT